MPCNTPLKVGDKFGKLTIIQDNGKNKYNYFSYIVKCECGKEKVYPSQTLRHRVCCGCTINKRPKSSKTLIGQQLEDLFVVRESHIGKSGHVYYECECQVCKSKLILASNRLKKIEEDKIKKCKHCIDRSSIQIDDIVGLKVGKITIIKLNKIANGTTYWDGMCECGNLRTFSKSNIKKALNNNQKLCCKMCLKEVFRDNYFKNVLNKEFYHKNKIETKVEEWLNINNIKNKYSFILDRLFQFDFIINDTILIEVQGDYWHSNPRIFKDGPIYDCQKERVNTDKIKLDYATKKGYTIYYIWEDEIKKNDFSSLYNILNIKY